MKEDANYNKAILALKRAIVATFDDGKWRELSYLTDSVELVSDHPRLLRSLYFGDDDYSGNVLAVLPRIIDGDKEKLKVVEEFVGLEQWLRENDDNLYNDLYDVSEIVSLEEVKIAAKKLDVIELNKHAARIRHGIQEDPEQAIGSAKELLETTLKAVLGIEGERSDEEIPALLKKAWKELNLDPKDTGNEIPGREAVKRVLNSLGQIVVGVAEVRNLYGTGHGRNRSHMLEVAHAKLVVNSAITIATFLLEVENDRK